MSGVSTRDTTAHAVTLRLTLGRIVRRQRQHTATGLPLSALSALATIADVGPLRLGDLAAREGVTPSTMTRILTVLDEAGLCQREVDPQDRRAVLVSTSAAGAGRLAELRAERTALLARQLAALDDDQYTRLVAALPVLEFLAQHD